MTNQAVVANEKSDSVSVIDLKTQTVIPTIPVGKAPRGIAIDKVLNIALVSNSHDNTVSVLDPTTSRVISTILVGKEPEGISVNPFTHSAVVTNHKDNTVLIIDLTAFHILKTIPAGKEPKDVVIDPELNLALIVNEKDSPPFKSPLSKGGDDGGITVIDLNTYQVTGTIPVGQKPQAIDMNPENHVSAVVNEKDNSITIIDLQTWQTTTIPVGKHPIDVAINPLDNRALVICDEDRSLLLIDLDARAVIKTYSIYKESKGVAVNNFTNMAAVIDEKADKLTLIQLPNPVPDITLVTPDNAERGSSDVAISIEGKKFITSSIAYLDNRPLTTTFADNHLIRAGIPKAMLSKAGGLPITVMNPSPDGGTSSSVTFTVNNPAPSIAALDPADAMAGTSGLTLNIYCMGFFEDTEVHFGGIKKTPAYISNTNLQIDLTSQDLNTPGQYEIMAYNLPPGGGYSNKGAFTVKNPLEIEITAPFNEETVDKAKIMVKGTVKSDTRDVGLRVNGIIAELTGKEWIANNVPLTIGSNTITATATDFYGNTDIKTIIIHTNDITQAIELSANITSGIAPLIVFFSASTSFAPVSYQMDFEGDGIIDHTGTTFENISYTYCQWSRKVYQFWSLKSVPLEGMPQG